MTTRPTTLVESDQLAQAAANVIKNEDFVPKGKKSWPFSRTSKARSDYDKSVQEITDRRREARENAIEQKLKKERFEVDRVFDKSKSEAQTEYDSKIAEARKPLDETEGRARELRDAAIAAANQAYQQSMDKADRVYRQEAGVIEQKRTALVSAAREVHDAAYAEIEQKRKADLAQIAKDLKTIPLEGVMRIVEDRGVWSPEERKKALVALVDMSGREDFDDADAALCLGNVASYVFQDRFLKPDAQHHRLMEVGLLEAIVDLALRCPEKRPTIVHQMHEIVVQNPGHSSPAFIKSLTELYVIASADTTTLYDPDPIVSENIFETMRAEIADMLRVTPRRNQAQMPAANGGGGGGGLPRENTLSKIKAEDEKTPVMARRSDADITADVDVRDLLETADS